MKKLGWSMMSVISGALLAPVLMHYLTQYGMLPKEAFEPYGQVLQGLGGILLMVAGCRWSSTTFALITLSVVAGVLFAPIVIAPMSDSVRQAIFVPYYMGWQAIIAVVILCSVVAIKSKEHFEQETTAERKEFAS
jgi:hypothetical protein